MKTKRICVLRLLALVIVNLAFIASFQYAAHQKGLEAPYVSVLSKRGSRGDEVRQIQSKLREYGVYTGNVDGIYGEQTEKAVRAFQRYNGLTVDGIAGAQTLKKLGISSSSGSSGGSNSDYELLARIISAESRGESYLGQVAVGAVVLNRVEHPSFPNSVSGVVYQPGAFSAINDGQINQPVAESSRKAAREALNGSDPSGGAIYYYNPAKTTNQWIRSRPVIKQIGKHLFCK